jgi:fumarylacetoacetase
MTLLRYWIESANLPEADFPLNNLPCGVFSIAGEDPRCGLAIGNYVLDLAMLEEEQLVDLPGGPLLDVPFWNKVMEAGPAIWAALRDQTRALLAEGFAARAQVEPHLHSLSSVRLHMPFLVSEYTDFYAGKHHAIFVGTMLRGAEHALPPNWLHIPIGYNGRPSSVVVSGTPVCRPWGQVKGPNHAAPAFQPSRRFDIELEMGPVVGQPSVLGHPVTVEEADAMIFGYVLLNDWSACDIQSWEYQPLGPFQAKATATTISPWIVMKAALEPFRTSTPASEKPLLPYLHEPRPMLYDIALEVAIAPQGQPETVIARTNYNEMYYSAA